MTMGNSINFSHLNNQWERSCLVAKDYSCVEASSWLHGNWSSKFHPQPLYIFKRRNGWIINFLNLHPLNIFIHQFQTNNIMPHIILLEYHPSYEQVIKLFKIFFPRI